MLVSVLVVVVIVVAVVVALIIASLLQYKKRYLSSGEKTRLRWIRVSLYVLDAGIGGGGGIC